MNKAIIVALTLILSSSIANAKWVDVSKKVCKAKGGEISSSGVCQVEWNQAKKICKAMGGRLPTIEELRDVVSRCGGTNTTFGNRAIMDKNKVNTSYQSCYKELGFTTSGYYWSTTTDASNTSVAWFVNFGFGSGNWDYKGYGNYVRCVR